MSDAVTLDLFIQDFVTTNKVMNTHYDWHTIVNRRFLEDGLTKVFNFQSADKQCYAIGRQLALPDADWFRIELTHTIPPVDEHRFDCLRMMQSSTHTGLTSEKIGDAIVVKLTTRHRGLVNIVFVIRDTLEIVNPFLI